ncbi:MAG: NAD-dependent epimerase/dehydratase family protein, partial [Gemmataceae bacterium]
TQSFFAELLKLPRKPRVLFTSTGLVYGDAPTKQTAFVETDPLLSEKPYPRSKIAAESIAQACGLEVVTVRLFNQFGPGQSTDFVTGRYAKAIAEAERGNREIVGNFLDGTRDFTDIRDTVVAFRLLMERGTPGEVYNVGSGVSHTIRSIVEKLLEQSSPQVNMKEGQSGTPDYSLANISKMQALTGWKPHIPLKQSLADILADWRNRLNS